MNNELTLEELNKLVNNLSIEEKFDFMCKEEEIKFIKNLVAYRKNKGISQRELAKITGLTQQAICSLEKLDRKPTLLNLIKYLKGLDLNINKIF